MMNWMLCLALFTLPSIVLSGARAAFRRGRGGARSAAGPTVGVCDLGLDPGAWSGARCRGAWPPLREGLVRTRSIPAPRFERPHVDVSPRLVDAPAGKHVVLWLFGSKVEDVDEPRPRFAAFYLLVRAGRGARPGDVESCSANRWSGRPGAISGVMGALSGAVSARERLLLGALGPSSPRAARLSDVARPAVPVVCRRIRWARIQGGRRRRVLGARGRSAPASSSSSSLRGTDLRRGPPSPGPPLFAAFGRA